MNNFTMIPYKDLKLSELSGMSSSASEIDANVNRSKQTIVLLGDSITQDNLPATAEGYGATGYFTWVQALLKHPFEVVNFAGISGQTSTQILSRVDTDVIPYNPSYCMFLCGMNDSDDTATLKSNILQIYTKLKEKGIFSFVLSNTPTKTEENKNLQAINVNQWLYEYFKDKPLVEFIDISKTMINPVSTIGSVKNTLTRDERHLSLNGAYVVGKYIADKLARFSKDNQYLPKSVIDNVYNNRSNSKNYFANCLFSTDSNSDGLSNNISQTLYNATCVNTIESSFTGIGNSQVLTITASGAPTSIFGYNVVMDFSTNETINTGEKYYAVCMIRIEGGAVNFKNINLCLNMAFKTVTNYDMRNIYETTDPIVIPSGGLEFMLKTPVYTVASGVTNFKARSVIQFTGAGSAVIKYSQLGVVKVD